MGALLLLYLTYGFGQQVAFKTRIFHCNVDSAGNLSLDILKDGWSPALTITKILLAIKSIFTSPDPCTCLISSLSCASVLFIPWRTSLRSLSIKMTWKNYFADNPLVPGIACVYLADREKHDKLAAEWTLRFAK